VVEIFGSGLMSGGVYLFFFLDLKMKTSGLNGGDGWTVVRTTAKPLMTYD